MDSSYFSIAPTGPRAGRAHELLGAKGAVRPYGPAFVVPKGIAQGVALIC